MPLVIADASPLIGLDRAGHLDLLPAVFPDLVAPPAVVAEFGRRPEWLDERNVENVSQVALLRALRFGVGESEALALAMENQGVTVLLDEKRARRFAAERGVVVVGTAGVVLRARERGLVPAARSVLDDLRATGFRLSDGLYHAVLKRAGE